MKLYLDTSVDEDGIFVFTDLPDHSHDNEYKVRNTKTHINRKRHILKDVYKMSEEEIRKNTRWNANGKLAKGKVHCSCPLCTPKTRRDGWKHSDKVKMAKGLEK